MYVCFGTVRVMELGSARVSGVDLACQPHEHIVDVSCSCCGNGPLITGQPPNSATNSRRPRCSGYTPAAGNSTPNRYVPKITDSQGIKSL